MIRWSGDRTRPSGKAPYGAQSAAWPSRHSQRRAPSFLRSLLLQRPQWRRSSHAPASSTDARFHRADKDLKDFTKVSNAVYGQGIATPYVEKCDEANPVIDGFECFRVYLVLDPNIAANAFSPFLFVIFVIVFFFSVWCFLGMCCFSFCIATLLPLVLIAVPWFCVVFDVALPLYM